MFHTTVQNCAVHVTHGNSECHIFTDCEFLGGNLAAFRFEGGSAQSIDRCFFFNSGWIVDFAPGNYYHDTTMSNCDAERSGPWFRSTSATNSYPSLYVTNTNTGAAAANQPCINWGGLYSVLSLDNCHLDPSQPNCPAVVAANNRLMIRGSKIGVQAMNYAGDLSLVDNLIFYGLTTTPTGSGMIYTAGNKNLVNGPFRTPQLEGFR